MQKSKIKKIGNSWYIKIPPNIHKNIKFQDNEEIYIDQFGNRLEIRLKIVDEEFMEALLDLNEGISLGVPKKISREELYETNRY